MHAAELALAWRVRQVTNWVTIVGSNHGHARTSVGKLEDLAATARLEDYGGFVRATSWSSS